MTNPCFFIIRHDYSKNRIIIKDKNSSLNKASIKLNSIFGWKYGFTFAELLVDSEAKPWIKISNLKVLLIFIVVLHLLRGNFSLAFKIAIRLKKRKLESLIRYLHTIVFSHTQAGRFSGHDFNGIKTCQEYQALSSNMRCYFASFQLDSSLDNNILFYLKAIKISGFDLVFITTSPLLPGNVKEKLSEVVNIVIHRENVGHDFVSWKTGIMKYDTKNLSRVLLVNDSAFVLKKQLDLMKILNIAQPFDMFGMTSSPQIKYHLQSFFIIIGENVLKSGDFQSFWESYDMRLVKDCVVLYGEISLTRFFKLKDYKIGSWLEEYINLDELGNRNPMALLWEDMIESYSIPFVKRSIVKWLGSQPGGASRLAKYTNQFES